MASTEDSNAPARSGSWSAGIDARTAAAVVARALANGWIDAADRAVVFHDLGRMRARIAELRASFPPDALHAVAIKANPLIGVLAGAVAAGAGLEAASLEEVHLALAAGCPADRIVFDSPAKTVSELAVALELGVHVNADNFSEIERIAAILAEGGEACARVGLRVNPVVGEGTILTTSVAGATSKFGLPIDEFREQTIRAFREHSWLRGLHVHVGSQGCDLEMLTRAVVRALDLREQIHAALGREQIDLLDIGGGLPAVYREDDPKPDLAAYVARLRLDAPALFQPGLRVVTEFGRAIQARSGFAVSRVEYVKSFSGVNVAVNHLGADFLMRPVYQPNHWYHEIVVLDPAGALKLGATSRWTIAGPLCFGGDILGRDLDLPAIEPGDLLLIRDVGAYTMGTWSHHCSRGRPEVLGFSGTPPTFEVLAPRETHEDVVRFWRRP